MKTTTIKLLIFLFSFSLITSCSNDEEKQFPLEQPSVIDAEDYSVYSAIVASYNTDKVVIKQKTLSGYTFIDDYFIEKLSEDNPGFEPEMATTLVEVNQNPLYLEESFNVSSTQVVLVSEAQLEYVFNDGYSNNDWKQFYNTFPNVYGFTQFSAVGYNSDKTKALIETSNSSCSFCGEGRLYYLEKENGLWIIKKTYETWIT
jgi:hypothetical protein